MATQHSRIEGAKEMAQVFRQLPQALQRPVLESALRAGGKIVVEDAERRLGEGKSTLSLRRHGITPATRPFTVSRSPARAAETAQLLVKPSKGWFVLMFREFGTKAHRIVPRVSTASGARSALKGRATRRIGALGVARARVLANVATGQVFGPSVAHPGQKARPFLGPAIASSAGTALEEIGRALGRAIEARAKRLAGSFAKSGLATSRLARGK